MNRKIAILGTLVFAGAFLGLFFEEGYIRMNYPDKEKYPVRGIDISHHQESVDWRILSRANLDFAFIKATEGGDHKDTKFPYYWEEAGKLGIARGAYHYFTFCKTGREQALNYMDSVPDEEGMLPPIINLEYSGNCSARPGKEKIIEEIAVFSDLVTEKYGKRPIIYATNKSYRDFLAGELPGYKIWIRDIYWSPSLPDGREWTFWQYTDRGKLWGVEGFVDFNVFNGGRAEFGELLGKGPAADYSRSGR
ncbi:MAG: glycoside hydrolase family 25 protein [Candidatus Dadabacteria bacterium]|nr:glycoside hydrolase family 25 protein [Candidatus Dadabacteria bacterium]